MFLEKCKNYEVVATILGKKQKIMHRSCNNGENDEKNGWGLARGCFPDTKSTKRGYCMLRIRWVDTGKLEANLPSQEVTRLRKGIKVSNIAEYNSILSTYGEYQVSTEEVSSD